MKIKIARRDAVRRPDSGFSSDRQSHSIGIMTPVCMTGDRILSRVAGHAGLRLLLGRL